MMPHSSRQRRAIRGLGPLILLLVLAALPRASAAGPVAEFERALRATYADYRAALFATNQKSKEQSMAALAAFEAGWVRLVAAYGTAPPPQYADDPAWTATVADVGKALAKAKAEIEKGELPQSHETLEAIRDHLGDLRARNGVVVFSDRINAFHETMEHVLTAAASGLDAAKLDKLRDDLAVMTYQLGLIERHPPAEAAAAPELQALLAALKAAVAAASMPARAGDAAAAASALKAIKPAFSRLFLKFG